MKQCLARLALVAFSATAVAAEPVPVSNVGFLALLQNGEVAGCAVKAAFRPGDQTADVAITLVRDPTTASGTRFVLSGVLADKAGKPQTLTRLEMTTASLATAKSFAKLTAGTEGRFETSAELGSLEGAEMMRDLMLGGADFILQADGGEPLDLKISGAMQQGIRGGYLNCAGDLFRPEAATKAPQ